MRTRPRSENTTTNSLTVGPGWFGIGFSVAALAALAAALGSIYAQQRQQNGDAAMRGSPRDRRAAKRAISIDQAITINASIERVRTFCQTPERLPKSIKALVADMPADSVLSIRTAPGDRGTEVRVHIPEDQTQSVFNRLAAIVGQDVAGYVRDDLRKMKQLIEIGEVVISEGPSMYRPAQPAADPAELRAAAGVSR